MTGVDLLRAAVASHDAFVVRAVRYLAADVGVRQFLDLGSGMTGGPMLHQIAQQIVPTAQVLYVTDDPDVLTRIDEHDAEGGTGSVDAVKAARTDPTAVLEHAGAALDLTAPVAVVMTGVLHLAGDAEAAGIVSELVDAVVTESHVVLSHLTRDIRPNEMDALGRLVEDSSQETWTLRSFEDVRRLFTGLDLVDPGVVQVDEWHPAINPNPPPATDGMSPLWVAVGRKP